VTGPAYHGWTHRPKAQGGTDPIEIPSSNRNRVVKYAIGGAEWKTSALWTTGPSSWAVVDPTVPFGGYIELDGDGEYMVLGAPLGPQWSSWAIDMAYRQTPDSGKVVFDWQTQLVDGTAVEYIPSVDEFAAFYNTNPGVASHQDFYAASAQDAFTPTYAAFVITGADDTMLSADGDPTSAPYNGFSQKRMNGGGNGNVMWYLRVRVNGHTSPSTGYKARIYWIAIRRLDGDLGFTLF